MVCVQVGASFIRFKALLETGDVEAVKRELARMVACADFDADLLKVRGDPLNSALCYD